VQLTVRNTSSLVIDSLCDEARIEDITVACLYCDFFAQQEQTIDSMMGAILNQLAGMGASRLICAMLLGWGRGELEAEGCCFHI